MWLSARVLFCGMEHTLNTEQMWSGKLRWHQGQEYKCSCQGKSDLLGGREGHVFGKMQKLLCL